MIFKNKHRTVISEIPCVYNFLAWDFFGHDRYVNEHKKAKRLLLQFIPMFTTFWIKCTGLFMLENVRQC